MAGLKPSKILIDTGLHIKFNFNDENPQFHMLESWSHTHLVVDSSIDEEEMEEEISERNEKEREASNQNRGKYFI